MRLIDADELKTAFPCGEYIRTESVRATIDHMSTIELERKQGEWIRHTTNRFGPKLNDCIECSQCGIWFSIENLIRRTYCPNCGSYNAGSENDT